MNFVELIRKSTKFATKKKAVEIVLACFLLLPRAGFCAEDKKEEPQKPQPPSIAVIIPIGIAPGITNHLTIRGQYLTNVTELRLGDTNSHAQITIRSKRKADVPKEMEAGKIGDTQIELELVLPDDAAPGTNTITAASPDGESKPHPLLVVEAASLQSEKEPNGGFRDAFPIQLGSHVQGVVHESKDVDVFSFHGQAKQKLAAEVFAARFGSPLDSLLTLYDAQGHILASNDDSAAGSDSLLRTKLPAEGTYFISLIDAHDHGSPAHVYLLVVRAQE